MRAVVQRVKECTVTVENRVTGKIGPGLLVFLGIGQDDTQGDADYMIDKIINLRIFADQEGKMNLSARDLDREIMVVSQFTLYGDCRKGRRPSFFAAASPDRAEALYDYFVASLNGSELEVASGEFQAMMEVDLINDGPVTMLVDSKKEF